MVFSKFSLISENPNCYVTRLLRMQLVYKTLLEKSSLLLLANQTCTKTL